MLLIELSARFVGATPESIDAEVINAQKQVVQTLDLDRSTLALQEPDRYVVTHCRTVPGLEPMPGLVVKDISWLVSTVEVRGEEVHFARVDDLAW